MGKPSAIGKHIQLTIRALSQMCGVHVLCAWIRETISVG